MAGLNTYPNLTADFDASSLAVADGSAVSSWASDAGSAAATATASGAACPTFAANSGDGTPALTFGGSQAMTTGNGTFAGDTAFTYIGVSSPASGSIQVVASLNGGNFYDANYTGSGGGEAGKGNFTNPSGLNTGPVYGSVGGVGLGKRLVVITYDGQYLRVRINGNNVVVAASGNLGLGTAPLWIGALGAGNLNFAGTISQLATFNRALLGREITAIEKMLAAKWRIPLSPSLVIQGNSFVAGFGAPAGQGLCDYVFANRPAYLTDTLSQGVSGQPYNATSIATFLVGGKLSPLRPASVYVIVEGINDLIATQNPVTTYTDMLTKVQSAYAMGATHVLVVTITASTGQYANFDADRAKFNANVRANWHQFCDGVADIAAVNVGAPGSSPNWYDGTHLNATGYPLWGAEIVAAITQAVPGVPPAVTDVRAGVNNGNGTVGTLVTTTGGSTGGGVSIGPSGFSF